MKSQIIAILALLLNTAVIQSVSADELPHPPQLVTINPENVFAPSGFDNNDNAQVTITGQYPNTCYKSALAAVRVDESKKQVIIRNQSYLTTSSWCLNMLVPYMQTVELGVLKAGGYTVMIEQRNGELRPHGNLSVAVSTNSGPDDRLYALVQETKIDPSQEAGPKTLTISGILTSTCMRLSEVRVISRTPNVIEVLPMVTVQDAPGCTSARIPFEERVALNSTSPGATLIHIRSLNGQSINRVVEF